MTDASDRYAITAAAPHARPSGGTSVGEYTVTIERYEDWRDDFPPAPPGALCETDKKLRATLLSSHPSASTAGRIILLAD
jgi:hypothetical protein